VSSCDRGTDETVRRWHVWENREHITGVADMVVFFTSMANRPASVNPDVSVKQSVSRAGRQVVMEIRAWSPRREAP
jgi:hypothetical protein